MSNHNLKIEEQVDTQIKMIEVGKFYLIFEGSKTGHPGYIIWKNDEHNLYLAIKFGTTPNKNNKKINCVLREGDKENFVFDKSFLGKRKNIGKKELDEMNITEEKLKELLSTIDITKPNYSPDIHRNDKRFFKWAIKNPLYQGQLSCPKGTADVNNIQKDKKIVNKNDKN